MKFLLFFTIGGKGENWTLDTRLFRPLLYHWATPPNHLVGLLYEKKCICKFFYKFNKILFYAGKSWKQKLFYLFFCAYGNIIQFLIFSIISFIIIFSYFSIDLGVNSLYCKPFFKHIYELA
ncbi:MAG: hypothetical protein ACD_2C00016G0013 [uncultured bacterium (gcode 4)]|uniref:Uncharacterized protein n=1 Tax=uncultured bacterium (gcode 4) TaxID=1234023 RepID=K2G7C5_9BACT|nr:MAG: hypothetical protein ACD_2C00016G0013 [uncultured bacterium (gcode 4)]